MRLITVRHGETDWNVRNKVLGRTDIPLNEEGIRQSEELAKELSAYNVSDVYSSPLDRAIETARMIVDATGAVPHVQRELIEQDFGVFEGFDRGEGIYQRAKRNFTRRFPTGESYFEVAARVYPFIESLTQRFFDDETVVIVTHGGICRMINSYFEELDNEEFLAFMLPNCGYKIYTIKDPFDDDLEI